MASTQRAALTEPSTSEQLDEALRRLNELAGFLLEGRLRDAVDDVAYGLACGVWVGRLVGCGRGPHRADALGPAVTGSAAVDAHVSTAEGGAISAPMVAALEAAWAAIRERHPEVPAAVIVLGAGSAGGAATGLKLGHFAAMRWTQPADEGEAREQLPEVFVGGEGLARGPVAVLGTLLHEAAHALAHVRGIKDTSRQGRWHNARFKALADELGIEVSKDDRLGWSPTTVPPATRTTYAKVVDELGRALRLHRAVEATGTGTTSKPAQPPCVCECGRRIRVAPSVLAAGPITCGVCGGPFEPDEPA